jgi:hypothetical protein
MQDDLVAHALDADSLRLSSISGTQMPPPPALSAPHKSALAPIRAPTSEDMVGSSCHHSSRQSSASLMEVEDAVIAPDPRIVPSLPQKQVCLYISVSAFARA